MCTYVYNVGFFWVYKYIYIYIDTFPALLFTTYETLDNLMSLNVSILIKLINVSIHISSHC